MCGWALGSSADRSSCSQTGSTGEEGPEPVRVILEQCAPQGAEGPGRDSTTSGKQMPCGLAEASTCLVSLSCPPSGWWARPWYPGDEGRGAPHSPLRALYPPLAFAMARLAAALWSLCVTTVLVTSATQGRCWGRAGCPNPDADWGASFSTDQSPHFR